MGNRRESRENTLCTWRQVQRSQSGRRELRCCEACVAGLVMPAEVQQFGEPGTFKQVSRSSGDPGLKLRPQIGGRLDVPVDLFLDPTAEPRYRQARDVFWFKVLDHRSGRL